MIGNRFGLSVSVRSPSTKNAQNVWRKTTNLTHFFFFFYYSTVCCWIESLFLLRHTLLVPLVPFKKYLINVAFSQPHFTMIQQERVQYCIWTLLPTHSSFCREEFDSQLGSVLRIAPELHSITHLTRKTSVCIHCTACTSLFGWPLNCGYQLAYSLSRLRCWKA